MAEVMVAGRLGVQHGLPHVQTVVAVEGIALDPGGLDLLAREDTLERIADGRGAGTG